MKLQSIINKTFGPGKIFSFEDIAKKKSNTASLTVMLTRLIKSGSLRRLEKGVYYVPEFNQYLGEVPPSSADIARYLCQKHDGYLSGINQYNKLGLTEQVANIQVIASERPHPAITMAGTRFCFTRAYCRPVRKDTKLLVVLDAVTESKHIPGTTQKDCLEGLARIISELNQPQVQKLVKYASNYPPRTRACLAGILKSNGYHTQSELLKNTLNPSTKFSYEY